MERLDFNQNWFFCRQSEEATPVRVDLPHDAMLHEKRNPSCKNANNTAWFPGGKYIYEKQFTVPKEYTGKQITLEFEGVYRNAKVMLNGELVAEQTFGYTGFYAKLSNVRYDDTNTVQVYVDNSEEPNSRWYSGSGIYREVHLLVSNKTHIDLDGIKIKTLSIMPPRIEINTSANGGEVKVEIRDISGDTVAYGEGSSIQLDIPNAQLWSENSPYLYTAEVTLCESNEIVDCQVVKFGIRQITWSTTTGLCINEVSTKLRGTCIHHDNGILGACAFREAERRKVRILKEAGFNAIRSAHNPCSKALLDACDEYGVYMMDEAFDQWFIPKNRFDYAKDFDACHEHDLRAMVNKDYNHPSVIMYSIGNEVSETQQPRGIELTKNLTEFIKELDSTRPVTCGINLFLNALISKGLGIYKEDGENITEKATSGNGASSKLAGSAFFNYWMSHMGSVKNFVSRAKVADKATRHAFSHLDICGYNYGSARYDMDGKKYPERIIVGSETFIPDLYRNWRKVEKFPYLIGDFMWVAWDYLGEAGIGDWSYGDVGGFMSRYPTLLASSGAIDITGLLTPECYYAQVAFGIERGPRIGVRPVNYADRKAIKSPWRNTDAVESWSWPGCEGKPANVEVYTDAHHVRLILNGKPVGKAKPKEGIARFKIPYEPGKLLAESFDASGKKLGETLLISAKESTKLTVIPEKTTVNADGQDLVYLDIRITDENGTVKVLDNRKIKITVEGSGILQGFGSAKPSTEESFDTDTHTTYLGRVQAIIRSKGTSGTIKAIVAADGLVPVSIEITAL